MDKFIQQWLDKPDRDPKQLSEYVVRNDHWDRKYFDRMLSSIDEFMINHESLVKKVETGSPMWADLYWLLWKIDPKMLEGGEIRPSHLINYLVGDEITGLSEYQKVKHFAEGDDVACALACIDLRSTLEQLFDKMERLKEKLQEFMKQLQRLQQISDEERDLEEMVRQWEEGFNPDANPQKMEQQKQDLEQQRQEIEQAVKEAAKELDEEVYSARTVVSQDLKKSLDEAADNAQSYQAQSELWGDEMGQIQRMNAEERLKLARKLLDRKFRRLLDLIGPLRRIMEEAQSRKVDYARDEVYKITTGNDLARILPSELAMYHHPYGRLEFFRKFSERELQQYELRGKEKVGRGEIICCLDNSGSMAGDKEMWGKAVAGCALHLARKQKRGFYGIHFASANQMMGFDFGLESDFTPQKVIDYMEFFFGGGTDFMRPLSHALDRLVEEHTKTGKLKGDIMFITDGLCDVSPSWLKDFKEVQARLEFKVWGFLIGGYGKDSEPLTSICDGNVFEVKDLLSAASTREMWSGI